MSTASIIPSLISTAPRLNEDDSTVECVNGQMVEKAVSLESSEIAGAVLSLLRTIAVKTGEAKVFDSTFGYRCFRLDPSHFRRPDVSLVRTERLIGVSPKIGMLSFPPDLAVEVVSEHDLANELAQKVDEYLANGFPLVWVIYPPTRSVVIHRADGSITMLHEKDEISGESALPGFRLKVAEFFGPEAAKGVV